MARCKHTGPWPAFTANIKPVYFCPTPPLATQLILFAAPHLLAPLSQLAPLTSSSYLITI